MLLSLLIAVFVAAFAWRGWARGLILEVVDLVGLTIAIVVANLFWPYVAGLLDLVLPIPGAVAVGVGGILSFGGALGIVLVVSRWASSHRHRLPSVGRRLDMIGGTVFSGAWSLLLITGLLLMAVAVPGSRAAVAKPVCDAPLARYLVGDRNPLHDPGQRLARWGQPVLLWVSQRMFETFTLADTDLPPGTARSADTVPVSGSRPSRDPGPCAPSDRGRPVAVEDTYYEFPAAASRELERDPAAEEAILELLNRARAEEGLVPLASDDALRDVGRAHVRDMYLRGYFAHETPECRESARPGDEAAGCRDPFDRMRVAGIDYAAAGENLALAPSPAAAHRALMESPSHRANILSPRYRHVGIGVYVGPYGLMVAQEFWG